MDELIENALEQVPRKIREELLGWIQRAQAGEVATVEQNLQGKLDTDWRRFERAVRRAEEEIGK